MTRMGPGGMLPEGENSGLAFPQETGHDDCHNGHQFCSDKVATALEQLARLYRATNRNGEAEPLEQRAAKIRAVEQ